MQNMVKLEGFWPKNIVPRLQVIHIHMQNLLTHINFPITTEKSERMNFHFWSLSRAKYES